MRHSLALAVQQLAKRRPFGLRLRQRLVIYLPAGLERRRFQRGQEIAKRGLRAAGQGLSFGRGFVFHVANHAAATGANPCR